MLAASGFVLVETLKYAPNKRTYGTNTIVADMRAFKPANLPLLEIPLR